MKENLRNRKAQNASRNSTSRTVKQEKKETHPMWQQIKQVGMTYWTRPRTWWYLFFYGFLCLGWLTVSDFQSNDPDERAVDLLTCCFLFSIFASFPHLDHCQWQFHHPRARLLPKFSRAHLTPIICILVIFLLLLPATLLQWMGAPVLSSAACMALITALILSSTGWIAVVFILMIFARDSSWVTWLLFANDGSNVVLLMLTLLSSWTAIGFRLVRLANMHEELSKYDQNTSLGDSASNSRTFRMAEDRKLSDRLTGGRFKGWSIDRHIDRILSKAHSLPKWRSLRLGNQPSSVVQLSGIVFILTLWMSFELVLEYRAAGAIHLNNIAKDLHSSNHFFLLWIFTFFVGAICGTRLGDRMPHMASESLFPLSKSQYINGLLRGNATDSLLSWAMCHLFVGILLHLPLSSQYPPPAVATCLAYLWISFACLCFTFSFVAWMAVYILGLALAILFAMFCGGITITLFICWQEMRESAGDTPFLVIATGMVGASWFMIVRASRDWVAKELGYSPSTAVATGGVGCVAG